MGGGGSTTISNTAQRISSVQIQTSAYGRCIPIIYGTQRIAGNIIFYDDFTATPHTTTTSSGGGGKGGGGSVTSTNTTYTYSASIIYALAEGQIAGVGRIWADKKLATMTDIGGTLFDGSYTQNAWGYLVSNHPDKAIAYRGTAYVANTTADLGDSATLPLLSFEVKGFKLYNTYDALPSDILYDFLTNVSYGVGFPTSKLGNFDVFKDYCIANSFFFSPMITEQAPAAEHISNLLKTCNSSFVWSEGVLKVVPYGDVTVTGNGKTFRPNNQPIYDLNDSDFLDHDEPVKITRTANADAFNHIKIEFLNRDNQYNPEIAEAKDLANIDLYGLRPSDAIQMHAICNATTAKIVAQLMLQRSLYIRNTYEFEVSWKYALLEPMDLVTLTDSRLGLSKTPVRITQIEETEENTLRITAEEFPFGVASATLYPKQDAQGTVVDYNVSSGNPNTPVIFEPPLLLANNYEIWLGFSGGAMWGGCDLWVSYDNASYAYLTNVPNPIRQGVVSVAWTNGITLRVNLTQSRGTLLTTSEALALVGDEVIKYSTATLVAAYTYDLTVVGRGLYSTTQTNHAIGERFARLDAAVVKQSFTTDMIGKTIYYKALSYNIYGAAKQQLADVSPFTFVIQGDLYPPAQVASFSYDLLSKGIQAKWLANTEIDIVGYEIRMSNTGWGDTNYVWRGVATRTNIDQTTQSVTYYIRALDSLGNYSTTSATQTVSIPNPAAVTGITATTLKKGIQLSWAANSEINFLGYEVRTSDSGWGSTGFVWKGDATSITIDQATQNATYYIRAFNTINGYSVTATKAVTIASPTAVANFGYTLDQGGINFKWDANTDINFDSYEVRTTDTGWGDSTALYKGNSTVLSLTPTAASQTYYIRAKSNIGLYSTTTSLAVSIAAPTAPSGLVGAFSVSSSNMALLTLSWTAASSVFGIDYYLVSYGSTSVKVNATTIQTPADWLGDRSFNVVAYDKMGFNSSTASLTVTKLAPNSPTNFTAQVIDNNVLFKWTEPTATSLPIVSYELRKGATWATATVIGKKSGGFTTVFESTGGVYTYWLAAIDADNRYSTAVSVPATVSQPPDFILKASYTSTFSGTKSNAQVDADGSLVMLIDTAATWTTHFTAKSWTTPQNQIDAGYPIYVQPALTPAYYEEVVDLGTILASSRVTVSAAGQTVSGTVTTVCKISLSADNISWTDYDGTWQVYGTNFRYYKFRITATGTDDKGLYRITGITAVLDAKLKNDAGMVSANAADASGTVFNFNVPFIDITSLVVTPQGTTPLDAVYDFTDTYISGTYSVASNVATINCTGHNLIAGQNVSLSFTSGTATSGIYTVASVTNANTYTVNMTTANTSGNVQMYAEGARVYLFNAAGTRVSGTVSWTARGY